MAFRRQGHVALPTQQNASWRPFDANLIDDWQRSVHCIIVRIWVLQGSNHRLVMEWHADLGALVYVGEHLFSARSGYLPNTILFGMFEGYYTAPREDKLSQRVLAASLEAPSLCFPSASVRQSYEKRPLAKFHVLHRKLTKSQYKVRCLRDMIAERLYCIEERNQLRMKCEQLRGTTTLLREELARQHECLQTESARLSKLQGDVRARERKLVSAREELAQAIQDVMGTETDLSERRRVLRNLTTRLFCRRCEMLGELQRALPICGEQKDGLEIVGINLPNAEEFAGRKNQNLAVAFGHVAQVLVLISCIMQLPLRHELLFNGSTSVIFDNIAESGVVVTNRACGLYPQQRADRDDFFKYAVFLLNKCIVQVRYQARMSTSDPRYTLANIKDFLDRMVQQRLRQLEEHTPSPLLTVRNRCPKDSTLDSSSSGNSRKCHEYEHCTSTDGGLCVQRAPLSQREELLLERRRLEVETASQALALLEEGLLTCVCGRHSMGGANSEQDSDFLHVREGTSISAQNIVTSVDRSEFQSPVT